jgi:hypothetical protein
MLALLRTLTTYQTLTEQQLTPIINSITPNRNGTVVLPLTSSRAGFPNLQTIAKTALFVVSMAGGASHGTAAMRMISHAIALRARPFLMFVFTCRHRTGAKRLFSSLNRVYFPGRIRRPLSPLPSLPSFRPRLPIRATFSIPRAILTT